MIQKLKQKIKLNRGSILGVTLIILGIMLISALSFSLVAVQNRKASMGENKSNQAFQTANTGAEKVLKSIRDHTLGILSDIDIDCDGKIPSSDGYTVQLQDDAGNAVTGCTTPVSAVKKVKSVGLVGQNQRAIEVAVAAGCSGGVKIITNGSAWGSADYNSLLDFIDDSEGYVIGAVCNSTAQTGRFVNISQVSYSDSGNTAQFIAGDGVITITCKTCAIGADCNKCMVGASPCQSFTILGSCSCPSNNCNI